MESFLTETQIKVLKLREKGYTQEKIAKMMNTSRANISMIEKRARDNIIKAQNTIKIYNQIVAPLTIDIKKNYDILDIPKLIYKTCDKKDINVKYNTVEIIDKIYKELGGTKSRLLDKDIKILIYKNGEIDIMVNE